MLPEKPHPASSWVTRVPFLTARRAFGRVPSEFSLLMRIFALPAFTVGAGPARRALWPLGTFLLLLCLTSLPLATRAQHIGNHPAVYDEHGILLPWTPWRDAIQREVNWYLNCPVENGYPRFVYMTFMNGNYEPLKKNATFIPATQDGMGIISYLKYHAWRGKKDPRVLQIARYMGDYLVKEANTPDEGKYPRFTRSTGWRGKCPQPPDLRGVELLPLRGQR
jgi:hypothetical protein